MSIDDALIETVVVAVPASRNPNMETIDPGATGGACALWSKLAPFSTALI
jgi:hypothetical protein